MKNMFQKIPLGRFFPFLRTIQKYSFSKFKSDIMAGLTVGIVALPQSMAYAIIAGVHPKYGLYAAIIPTIISSLFGSSRFLIAGPTNAISMVVFSTTASTMVAGIAINGYPEEQKIAFLFLLAFLIGIIQILMGVAKLGSLVNFISHSVIIGFTAGAGVLIAFNQIKNFLGINIPSHAHFLDNVKDLFYNLEKINFFSLGIGIFTVASILLLKKFFPKAPGPFISMIFSAVIVAVFGLGEEGVRLIGTIPQTLPPFSTFPFDLGAIKTLIGPALAIAILGIVEALSIAKSIANSSGEKINGNQEFIGQGLSNLSAAFFSSIPGSGSFTRSAVNFKAGAVTRFAGVFSGIIVLSTILIFAGLAKFIPIASLAGILMIVSYSMIDKKGFVLSFRATRADRMVLLATLLSTIFFELEMAVYVGVFMSIVLFLRKVSRPQVTQVFPREEDNKLVPQFAGSKICPQIAIFQIDGSLFFGAVSEMEEKLHSLREKQNSVIIVRMKGVRIIDATGVHALEKFWEETQKQGVHIIFTGIKPAVLKVMKNSGVLSEIGKDNIVNDTTQAVKLAHDKYLDKEICRKCGKKVFAECS